MLDIRALSVLLAERREHHSPHLLPVYLDDLSVVVSSVTVPANTAATWRQLQIEMSYQMSEQSRFKRR